jgi:hypothetical protein
MVKDIIAGTVLPPIVLGLITDQQDFEEVAKLNVEKFPQLLDKLDVENLTIIDGMQRTTALNEAVEAGADLEKLVRIEFWIARKLNSLIYRMLVLNTGQVPWNLRRQVETVFGSMIKEIRAFVPEIEIYTIDDSSRRSQGGQYHANDIIELYLAFGGRKEKVDTKQRLADEFTRLDFIEATENSNFADLFYESLKRMVRVDKEFSKGKNIDTGIRFSSGKDLFKSQPARVGFITAIGKKILGRPGVEKSLTEIEKSAAHTYKTIDDLVAKLSKMNELERLDFLALNMLSEKLSIKSSRVGDFEREFFAKGFEVVIEEGADLDSMSICWQAY